MRRSTALLIAVVAVLLIAAQSARAVDWPPLRAIAELQEKANRADELERQNRRLKLQNRRLRRHLSGYGRWVRNLQRTLRYDPEVSEALNLSSVVYGVPRSTLWRRARCESHLYPRAKSRRSSAKGLLQFLDSTWASTPFGRFNVYSPYANALAGGWMMGPAGRGGEWECR